MEESPQEMSEWCNGLELVAERPLSHDEGQTLSRESRRLRRQGLFWIIFGFTGLGLATAALLLEANDEILSFLWVGWILFAMPTCTIGSFMAFRGHVKLRKELAVGMVKEFAAANGSPPPHFNSHAPTSLAVLSATNRIWRVNGIAPNSKWKIAPVTAVATTPKFAEVAAQWLSPKWVDEHTRILIGARDMGAAERNELAGFGRALLVRFGPLTLLFNTWFISIALATVFHRQGPADLIDFLLFISLATMTIMLDFYVARLWGSAAKIRLDTRQGRILITRQAETEANATDSQTYEILPNSRWLWTIDGTPAPWRTSGVFGAKR